MKHLNLDFIKHGKINREEIKLLLFAAIQTESFQFSRRLALIWLDKYPGDLEIKYIYSRILIGLEDMELAQNCLAEICETDPEFVEAQELFARISNTTNENPSADALACVYAMGKTIYSDFQIPEWSFIFRTAWQAYLAEQFDNAEVLIKQVIVQKPQLALAAILHHRIVDAQGDEIASQQLAHIYNARFPNCINFLLCIAEELMDSGSEIEAIELLHKCVTSDSLGIVANRIWGNDHRYQTLWPEVYEVAFDLAIPAEVASFLGVNNLPEGEIVVSKQIDNDDVPERLVSRGESSTDQTHNDTARPQTASYSGVSSGSTVQAVDEIFEKLAKKLKQPDLVRTDGRFPVYVILSLKSKLIKKYGKQTFLVLDTELRNLAKSVASNGRWDALVFYPDDASNMVNYGLTALESEKIDPWGIKNKLSDLDKALYLKGEMIGALLIVGGSDIVPHHRLPNPTDDMDDHVASDNPYANLDGNYFVQEWPIGRLPDEEASDAGLLLCQIRSAISNHVDPPQSLSWLERILSILRLFQTRTSILRKKSRKASTSFGYSAAIWQKSSAAAFRPIGSGQKIVTSPPEQAGSISPRKITGSNYGYYNLHGLEDSPEWYGQREIGDIVTQSDYPVALSPNEISRIGQPPDIIFSEACYGAFVEGKSEDDSIAMKFLGVGAKIFIGSTCIAYGSIDMPLIGADLLSSLFWKNIFQCESIGEAYVKAKLELVKEMDRRQGFLDGEDQKTLLSFVYYGDPLASLTPYRPGSKKIQRRLTSPEVKVMSDLEDLVENRKEIPAGVIQDVKKIAEIYLPGLEEFEIHVNQQQLTPNPDPTLSDVEQSFSKKNVGSPILKGQTVITVSKAVPVAKRIHYHYLRARLNSEGFVDKISVSR